MLNSVSATKQSDEHTEWDVSLKKKKLHKA